MSWTTDDIADQSGRVAVVTGANSGLGLETAVALAAKGAHVVMAVRDPARGEAARKEVLERARGASVETSALDLASLDSVRAFAERTIDAHPRIDLLFNNAGVMALPREETADGFERQIGTNHLGHFALTGLLLPGLVGVPGSRVVTTTSLMRRTGRLRFDDLHGRRRYRRWEAYGQSKLANLVFAVELQRRLEDAAAPTASLAAHPGYSRTNLQRTSSRSSGSALEAIGMRVFGSVGQSAAAGALPQLRAALDPAASGGELYGPALAGFRGAPTRERIERRASDAELGRRLWEVSVRETGVDPRLEPAAP
ncbi:MAG: SDR family NAD(P)-dependent oxidoreductase [Actinobacteria bacterium]|nr:SDR family NAD(P)-dependent oxidoreductase [Actinomycetota bacterium]